LVANGGITCDTDKFTVADTSGNTAIGGTLDVTGATTLTTLSYNVLTEVVTATNVLEASESGKTCFLKSGTEFVSTLPAPAAGLNYKFIVDDAPLDTSYTIITNGSANIIYGIVVVHGAAVSGVDANTITFGAGSAIKGDWVQVVSDGTDWYVSGQGFAAGSITLT